MNSYHGPFPCLIKRYMDDIIGATSLPLESLQEFINYTNNFHPALQFTHNITEDSLPFLDLRLTIKDDTISTTIYYKETDAHSFLDYGSSHPKKCKDSIPYSQLRRLRRICTAEEDFDAKAKDDINNSTTVSNGNRNFTIRSAFTCASSSVVYCITCTKCNILYIGETSRQIKNRFGEHLRNVRNRTHLDEQHENDPDSNISHHFNLPNHSTDDMSILGRLYASTESTKRKTLEKRIIFALGTLYPSGLNKHFTYLQ